MRILVTGGIGRVGKAVVERLLQHGFSLLVVDQQADVSIPGADYAVCDMLDYACVRQLVCGCDAVVHLAAIPSPGLAPNQTLFNINVTGTYNIFQAAAEEGIRRVVQASSINAVGYYFGIRDWRLSYLPIDEEHPTETSDPYSLSKSIIEEIGRYFWRRAGISSIALRFPAVVPYATFMTGWISGRQEALQEIIQRLLKMTVEARQAWFEESRRAYDDLRGRHAFEDPDLREQMYRHDSPISPELRVAMGGRYNFFAMIDEHDAAQAVEKGLTADYEGSYPLFVNDRAQWTGLDSSLVASLFYPDVPALKKPLLGHEALVSNEQARRLIGFDPEYTLG